MHNFPSMESRLFFTFLFLSLADSCYGGELFSSLPRALHIFASPQQGQVLRAGEVIITVEWGSNESVQANVGLYKNTKVVLCYAPVSQVDRGWRKTSDDLSKDKTCQFTIVERLHDGSMKNQSFQWMIEKDVPEATYFVRVYAYNSAGEMVAFGQTTDANKSSNLFEIRGLTGHHLSLDIASVCFSAFSVVSLLVFCWVEKKRNKGLSRK